MSENKADLTKLFIKVFGRMHRIQSHQFREFGPMGNPHRGQGRVLSILKLQPEISQKELGYLLDMRNQSLGELLNKLEKSGFIERTPSNEDRRAMNIKLTQAGAQAASKIERTAQESDQLFSGLTLKEQDDLRNLLIRLLESLDKQTGKSEMGEPDERDFGGFFGFRDRAHFGRPAFDGRRRWPEPEHFHGEDFDPKEDQPNKN